MPDRPRSSSPQLWLLGAVALAVFAVPTAADFLADWLWFGEVGYRPMFTRSVTARSLVATVVFVLVFGAVQLSLRAALKTMSDGPRSIVTRDGIEIRLPSRQQIRSLASVGAAVVSLLAASWASSRWLVLLVW